MDDRLHYGDDQRPAQKPCCICEYNPLSLFGQEIANMLARKQMFLGAARLSLTLLSKRNNGSRCWVEVFRNGIEKSLHYSIRSDSRRGSSTPFWSLPLSKPSAESARTVTLTLPARSARLAMAFHAENN
jgi:hypothetical protein